MNEHAERKPKTIRIPGLGHPITIEPNPHQVVVTVAGRVVADTRVALTLREARWCMNTRVLAVIPAFQWHMERAKAGLAILMPER
jgi:uncharacterized protein (DUF427 family)